MRNDLLTVPEFVALTGKKKQGIYQQIRNENSKLFKYVVKEDNRVWIKREALLLYRADGQGDSQVQSSPSQGDSQVQSSPSQTQEQKTIEFLQEQIREKDKQLANRDSLIEEQNRQLANKDRIIEEKDKQLNEITRAFIQASQNRLLAQSNYQQEQQQETKTIEQTIPEEQHQEPKKKRGWLARLFLGDTEQ